MRGVWSPLILAFIATCVCAGMRQLAASRLTRGFGMAVKAAALLCILYPVGAYFQYVSPMSLVAMGAWFLFGIVLLNIGDDIMETPAPPQIPNNIYGDPQMMATAKELNHALKSKNSAFDPSFMD